MSSLLFSAYRVDWSGALGSGGPEDAIGGESRYLVYDDGTCEVGMERGNLSPEAWERLRELFYGDFLHAAAHQDACDGEGWWMALYAPDGSMVHETGLGAIYGVPVLEEIAAILMETDPCRLRSDGAEESDLHGENPARLSPEAVFEMILEGLDGEAKRRKGNEEQWVYGEEWE